MNLQCRHQEQQDHYRTPVWQRQVRSRQAVRSEVESDLRKKRLVIELDAPSVDAGNRQQFRGAVDDEIRARQPQFFT
jgi:hypothetical protein